MAEQGPLSGASILKELGAEGILDYAKLTWALVKDNRIPLRVRALPALGLAYLLKGKDLIPDTVPVIGRLDDVLILAGSAWLITQFAPPEIVQEHRQRIAADRQRRNTPSSPSSPNSPDPARSQPPQGPVDSSGVVY